MLRNVITGVIVGASLGVVLEFINGIFTFMLPPFIVITPLCVLLGAGIGAKISVSRNW
jgi:hypothetical protein